MQTSAWVPADSLAVLTTTDGMTLYRRDRYLFGGPQRGNHPDTLGMSLVHTNKTLQRLQATKTMRWKELWPELTILPADPAD